MRKHRVFINQYGRVYYARTLKELRAQIPGRLSKMYQDGGGKIYHIGYVVGSEWLDMYESVAREVDNGSAN